MNPVLIFRHVACEGPGYLADVLDRRSIPWELIPLDDGAPVPRSLGQVSGLVFMGGPTSVNDDLPWVREELALIRQAAQARLPVLGHCLGGQLISKALGGTVSPNPVREIGWLPVERLDTAVAQQWLGALPARFPVFHWHGETFSVPRGAVPMLRSEHCDHQAFALDDILALQCHVEITAEMVVQCAEQYSAELDPASPSVQTFAQMTARLAERIHAVQQVADVLYTCWTRPLLKARE
jgi:GMP synthase-like glutamine amidotransferase